MESFENKEEGNYVHPIELMHAPSYKAIELAYADADLPGYRIKNSLKLKIKDITTTLAVVPLTYHIINSYRKDLLFKDKDVLALAAVRDLVFYKEIELQRAVLDKKKIDEAIEKVHQRNYGLGIYSKEEAEKANKYTETFKTWAKSHLEKINYKKFKFKGSSNLSVAIKGKNSK